MRKTLIASLFACCALSLACGDESLAQIVERSAYSKTDRDLVFAAFAGAEETGIDERILLPRLQEAISKHVSASVFLDRFAEEVDCLIISRRILLSYRFGDIALSSDSSWQRTANLIKWGATDDEISSIGIASSFPFQEALSDPTGRQFPAVSRDFNERYSDSTYLFVSLVTWGLDRDLSLSLTKAISSSSIDRDEFAGVTELLILGRRLMLAPEEVAERIIVSLPESKNMRQLGRKVLYE